MIHVKASIRAHLLASHSIEFRKHIKGVVEKVSIKVLDEWF